MCLNFAPFRRPPPLKCAQERREGGNPVYFTANNGTNDTMTQQGRTRNIRNGANVGGQHRQPAGWSEEAKNSTRVGSDSGNALHHLRVSVMHRRIILQGTQGVYE
jgi:hypothetical protein